MIIGIPTNDRKVVESHFGHCKEFALYDIEDGKIVATNYVTPPPHAPGVIPKFLAEQKVNVIICGGMGQMAINLFKENGIEVILGAVGSVEKNLQEFIKGELMSTGVACEHKHH
jgi:predicted Fe-Mo cluster-binding NifX family protein